MSYMEELVIIPISFYVSIMSDTNIAIVITVVIVQKLPVLELQGGIYIKSNFPLSQRKYMY